MARRTSEFQCGDHGCAFYSTQHELAALVSAFLSEGVARNERCWYVAAGREGAAVKAALSQRNLHVDIDNQRALSIKDRTTVYVVDGDFSSERTVAAFSDAVEQACRDGFTGFRVAADVSWALALPKGGPRLIAYEAQVRSLFASRPVTALCLYHRKKMPLKVLRGALVTHSIVGAEGGFEENPFYDPNATSIPDGDEPPIIWKNPFRTKRTRRTPTR